MSRNLVHLNGNVLCAVDTETTGLNAGFHDVIEVAILPLDSNFEPRKDIIPFNILLKPKRPDNIDKRAMDVNKIQLHDIMMNGFDPYFGAELFEQWVEKLNLPTGKKIAPLCKNWPFDKSFIADWLGQRSTEDFFFYHYRDLGPVANFVNDCFDYRAEPPPFPKQSLAYIANLLGVPHDQKHRALDDCILLAECYKRMVRKYRLL